MPASRKSPLVLAIVAMTLLPVAALAQAAPTEAPDAASAPAKSTGAAETPPAPENNPHLLLNELHGGPAGSPTAQRGNPQPGTSTSIPTINPADVKPITAQGRRVTDEAVEDTGIDGQCDPNVSFGCPTIPGRAVITQPRSRTAPVAADEATGTE